MAEHVIWHGSVDESNDLVNAIARNCDCQFGLMGVRLTTCITHDALLHDQHWLDWLLYLRRTRACLTTYEWSVEDRAP